jgi:DNA-binding response OmpR family regulator
MLGLRQRNPREDTVNRCILVIEDNANIGRLLELHLAVAGLQAKRVEHAEPIQIGDLSIDIDRREVRCGDLAVELTAKEFDLLAHFARSPGRLLSRAQLLQQVWGYSHSGYEHTVNTQINRLRAKIERNPNRPQVIETVWGVGYRCRNIRETPSQRA